MYIEKHKKIGAGFRAVEAGSSGRSFWRRTWLCGLVALTAACTTAVPPSELPATPPAVPQEMRPAPDPIPIAATPRSEAPTDGPREHVLDPPAIREGRSVFFAKGSAELDANAHAVLKTHAVRLQDDSKLVVTLVGHSDHLGSRSYNLAVADQRVTAVAKTLRRLGVQRSQIRRYSLGNEKPGVQCQNETCRSKWRRVDIVYRRSMDR